MDEVECEDCGSRWATSRLSISGPIKEYDEAAMRHTKRWVPVCPGCFGDRLKVLIRIPVCM